MGVYGPGSSGTPSILAVPVTTVGLTGSAVSVEGDTGNLVNAQGTVTLGGVPGKTTYLSGFYCAGLGSTAALVTAVSILGIATGIGFPFTFPAGVTVPFTLGQLFTPHSLPGSAPNTAITVTIPAGGAGNTNARLVAWGYQV